MFLREPQLPKNNRKNNRAAINNRDGERRSAVPFKEKDVPPGTLRVEPSLVEVIYVTVAGSPSRNTLFRVLCSRVDSGSVRLFLPLFSVVFTVVFGAVRDARSGAFYDPPTRPVGYSETGFIYVRQLRFTPL